MDLDLSVKQGEIFGFLGPNGAGKTTTIRLLLGLIKPSRGAIYLLGREPARNPKESLREIGYIPGDIGLYRDLSGIEYLEHFLRLRFMKAADCHRSGLEDLMNRFSIDFRRKIRDYSKGMRQTIGVIQAFMHEPRLEILDEPTSGLDPIRQQVLYDLLEEGRSKGRTVFLSSHVFGEVERVCDRIGIIKDGRLAYTKELEKGKAAFGKKVTVDSADHGEQLFGELAQLQSVRELGRMETRLSFIYSGDMGKLLRILSRHSVIDLTCENPGIEEDFFKFYEGKADDRS